MSKPIGMVKPSAAADAGVKVAAPFSLTSAGSMIREARKAQGLHIAALAAAIKVSQQKLELLEADRYDELPDATFVRALAQTVCRSLKIDPQPVLAQLPQVAGHRLDLISEGINTPFRDRPGRRSESGDTLAVLARPGVWGPALVVLAALALYLAPAGWLGGWPNLSRLTGAGSGTAVADAARAAAVAGAASASVASVAGQMAGMTGVAASAAAGAGSAAEAAPESTTVVETTYSAPPPSELMAAQSASAARAGRVGASAPGALSATLPANAGAGATLQLRANAESWVEVLDARSQVLLQRMLQPGETVALEGTMPMRLKVGNAAGTEAVFRGKVIDLAGSTRDNVARLELK